MFSIERSPGYFDFFSNCALFIMDFDLNTDFDASYEVVAGLIVEKWFHLSLISLVLCNERIISNKDSIQKL